MPWQVYLATVLKDLRELCKVIKNSLWVTKVTAQALGLAIAAMVVQKHELWLELVEIKEAKKVKFLDTLSPKQDCLMKRWRPLPSSSW